MLRIRDLAPSPQTMIVVNCAGRTRSIVGAQSLINAGVPNKVVALRNGTMGWNLAGLTCDAGKSLRAGAPTREGLAWAKSAAQRVARRFGVPRIDPATLARWQSEREERTLYLFDVRDPGEYEAGHVAGALSAPGGQLVQATDQYVGTLGARIVLIDDAEVRALMTASWLRQMGWTEVAVLAAAGSETGWPATPILGPAPPPQLRMDCAALARAHRSAMAQPSSISRSAGITATRIFRERGSRSARASRARLPDRLARHPRADLRRWDSRRARRAGGRGADRPSRSLSRRR